MLPYDWLELESDRVRKVKFVPNPHDQRGDVLVEFIGGQIYRYRDVPSNRVERMVHASDPGGYFHGQIRGIYETVKEGEV